MNKQVVKQALCSQMSYSFYVLDKAINIKDFVEIVSKLTEIMTLTPETAPEMTLTPETAPETLRIS